MALFITYRTLHRVLLQPKQLISYIIHSATPFVRNCRKWKFQNTHFSQAFHRTPLDHHQSPRLYRTLDKGIDFIELFDKTRKNYIYCVDELVNTVKKAAEFSSVEEAVGFLEKSGVEPNEELVLGGIWDLRDEWRSALIVFKWGEKRGCLGENVWALMIWVLGSCEKFNIAWCLIREMYRFSVDTRRAMLVMIDRYTAANNPSKAIHTFEIMEKFRITPDIESFHTLLSSLCKYGNIEEAEEFMLSNKKLFPMETESFNIILNGWSNVSNDVLEAKRIWREMSKHCIVPNENTYTHMISCFSKVGNLFDCLRLYDEMKKRGFAPSLEVYDSLVYVLTRENCLEQAMRILEKMKEEGVKPNSSTYNSIIRPLCEATKFNKARDILATMIEENIDPTIETYHSFLKGASVDETMEILKHMKKAGIGPNKDTFLCIFHKLFRLKQPENALNFRDKMEQFEIAVDYMHYCVLVEGLVNCGSLIKAREVYDEMKTNGFVDDPKLKKLVKAQAPNSSHIREKEPSRVVRDIKDIKLCLEKSSGTRRTKRRKKLRKERNVS